MVLEFGVLVFVEGGKPENLEKNPLSKDENQQQTKPTYDTGPELKLQNPGHIGGRRALSPLCHPRSPKSYTVKSIHEKNILQDLAAISMTVVLANHLTVQICFK